MDRSTVQRWSRKLIVGIAVVAAACLHLTAVPAEAQVLNQTSYYTWNMGGQNTTYGTLSKRLSAAQYATDRWYGFSPRPFGVAFQELCNNIDPNVTDAYEVLTWNFGTYGVHNRYAVETKVGFNGCRQLNGVWVAGGTVTQYAMRTLPADGDEDRVIVCLRVNAFVATVTCSTHLSTVSDAWRNAQAIAASDFVRYQLGDYIRYVGGDFNDTPGDQSIVTFESGFDDADRFVVPPRGRRSLYSDHQLLWAPFHWVQ